MGKKHVPSGFCEAMALAALAEIRFFSRIMFEHAKFIRGGLDPTREQEPFIRRSSRFAHLFGLLEEAAEEAGPRPTRIHALALESYDLTVPLRDFKAELAQLVEGCRATAFLPGDLLVHLRKEADFFLGLLDYVLGRPGPTFAVLGLPDGYCQTVLLPRFLIGCVPADLNLLSAEYGLFWSERHHEHAAVLGEYTRPQTQTALLETFTTFAQAYAALQTEGAGLPKASTGTVLAPAWSDWIHRAVALTGRWREFLAGLYRDLLACRVPARQINIYPLLVDHIRREADYMLDALYRLLTAAGACTG